MQAIRRRVSSPCHAMCPHLFTHDTPCVPTCSRTQVEKTASSERTTYTLTHTLSQWHPWAFAHTCKQTMLWATTSINWSRRMKEAQRAARCA